jgi:phytoene/squalene synthetase
MMNIFDKTSYQCSSIITQNYSTSFSLGIKVLSKKFHNPIYGIYGFVRFADEIVDTFHDYNKKALLDDFKKETYEAIENKVSLNPVLNSFQLVVNHYRIKKELIEAFFTSMEMDLQDISYDNNSYNEYIYGSAEVVGLMCLQVFCEGDDAKFNELKHPARKLGAAFQKVNFLRDINSDFQERGRVYFPGLDLNDFSQETKLKIEQDIEGDFDEALKGIVKLPKGSSIGVYLAYVYYMKLFGKIRSCPVSKILTERIRVPDIEKLILLLKTYFKYRIVNHNIMPQKANTSF